MDPFEDHAPNTVPQPIGQQEPPLFDLARPWMSGPEHEHLTMPEKSLGYCTSTVKRAFMLVVHTAAFACLVLFSKSFLERLSIFLWKMILLCHAFW